MVDKLVKSVDYRMLGWIENILDTESKTSKTTVVFKIIKKKFRKDQFSSIQSVSHV